MPTGVRMYVDTTEPLEKSSLEILRKEFMQAFSFRAEDFYAEGPLEIVRNEERANMPVKTEGSICLNVNLWKSYYGVGYERGNPLLFVQCAEWLEERLPGCDVYYGHDVTDESVSLFDESARLRLMEYYRKVGDRADHSRKSE